MHLELWHSFLRITTMICDNKAMKFSQIKNWADVFPLRFLWILFAYIMHDIGFNYILAKISNESPVVNNEYCF